METQNITLIKQYFQYFNDHNWEKWHICAPKIRNLKTQHWVLEL